MTSECPSCRGTGWMPAEEGRVRRCSCRQRRVTEPTGVPARFATCSFETFYGLTTPLEEAVLQARAFVAAYPDGGRGLLFEGPIGAGKTHLAVATLRELAGRGVRGAFVDCSDLHFSIRAHPTNGDWITRQLISVDVLLVDNLGAIGATPGVERVLEHVLHRRLEAKRPLLATTAYAVTRRSFTEADLFERIGARACQLLKQSCDAVPVVGEDFRLRVRQEANRVRDERVAASHAARAVS